MPSYLHARHNCAHENVSGHVYGLRHMKSAQERLMEPTRMACVYTCRCLMKVSCPHGFMVVAQQVCRGACLESSFDALLVVPV